MRFPPPIRCTAPLVALAFGLVATWFDYRLNLDLDRDRHLGEVRESAEANGRRLGRLSERLLATGQQEALQADVEAMSDLPGLEIAAVVDEAGRIIVDSSGTLRGHSASKGPLAQAAALMNATGQSASRQSEDAVTVSSAYSFRIGARETGWALLEFDRTEAGTAALADARRQLGWIASAMAVLSLLLWSILHFGFGARWQQLAESVRAFGEGKVNAPLTLGGGDEVGELSGAISAMAAKLATREAEQVRLEREILEISEGERQRIGHDLHDGLGQRLTAASLTANALVTAARKADAPDFAERGEDLGRQLRAAIAEARSLAHGLAPVDLVDDGLMSALAALAGSTTRPGAVRCVFECPELVRVANPEIAGHLYRIAQESVNNSLKHAGASEIRIGLASRDGAIVLEVDDDGDGFNSQNPAGDGIGIRVMRYRARLMKGELETGSAPAGGARISCRVKLSP